MQQDHIGLVIYREGREFEHLFDESPGMALVVILRHVPGGLGADHVYRVHGCKEAIEEGAITVESSALIAHRYRIYRIVSRRSIER